MNNRFQKTLSKEINLSGIGLHSGKKTNLRLLPADENTGIIFKRIDLSHNNLIAANYKNVTSAKLCTTLENSFGAKVSTVEHLLAAFYISGVDNALVEIDSEEVPIMDGSAKDFLIELKKIEIIDQSEKRKYLKISNKVELIDGKRKISIEPNEKTFEVEFQLNYENKVIGKQKNIINFQKNDLSDLSESRTFCLYQDIKKIKKFGLAKGGSLENALVVDNDKVINEGGLRNEKEFVNHKILDLAGDFLLSGYRIIGKVVCKSGGHELSNLFLRKIFSTNKSFHLIDDINSKISENYQLKEIEQIAVNA